ncbi:MAG: metal ABC transporter substrate-binding protein [Clostridia bacterium]|nr:metal ABC transporter substrate-binding protein [Clostridia bacterium]
MKKLSILLIAVLLFSGCEKAPHKNDASIQIVASLFPQYDFAREICKDKASVSILLPAGTDSHSYEPTPADIVSISKADLFLYTGAEMEPWADRLTQNVGGKIINVADGCALLTDADKDHAHASHVSHDDPHVWTDPQNAIIMVQNICEAVCEIDPANKDFYIQNTKTYIDKLSALDKAFESCVATGKRKTVFFGGHFAVRYFIERYGLNYHAAYDSCAGDAEPSTAVLMEMITEMKAEGAPVIYYEELSTPRTAQLIANETGAKMLLFHSCHNISSEEHSETYLSLMEKNLINLKIGLN